MLSSLYWFKCYLNQTPSQTHPGCCLTKSLCIHGPVTLTLKINSHSLLTAITIHYSVVNSMDIFVQQISVHIWWLILAVGRDLSWSCWPEHCERLWPLHVAWASLQCGRWIPRARISRESSPWKCHLLMPDLRTPAASVPTHSVQQKKILRPVPTYTYPFGWGNCPRLCRLIFKQYEMAIKESTKLCKKQ